VLADVSQRHSGDCTGTGGLFLPPSRNFYLNQGFRRLSMNFSMKPTFLAKMVTPAYAQSYVRVPGTLSGRQPFLSPGARSPGVACPVSSLPLFETEIRSLSMIFEMKTNGSNAGCGALFPQYVTFRRWA